MLKTKYEILSNLDFLDVKIKEVFVGKKENFTTLKYHNVFKISITLKKDDVDLSKLHSHSQRIKFSEIKMRLN
jgi:hypothetical protein